MNFASAAQVRGAQTGEEQRWNDPCPGLRDGSDVKTPTVQRMRVAAGENGDEKGPGFVGIQPIEGAKKRSARARIRDRVGIGGPGIRLPRSDRRRVDPRARDPGRQPMSISD